MCMRRRNLESKSQKNSHLFFRCVNSFLFRRIILKFRSATCTIMDSSVQSNLNSTLFDVQNTSEFQRLKQIEQEDLQELNKGISYINEEIFTEGTDYEEQIRILGEAIAVTLLAHDHRGGYGIDNNGLQTFKSDLQ